jgi:magnesium transporter
MAQVENGDASHGPEVVASVAYYTDGKRCCDVPISEAHKFVGKESGYDIGLLWLGLRNPGTELLAEVGRQLKIGAKALDEVGEIHRRPKIVDYGDCVLVVAITVELEGDRPVFGETQLLIGAGYLMTVRRGAATSYTTLRERLESAPELLSRGSDYIASEVLDLLVDRYVATAGRFEAVVETAEQKLLVRAPEDADVRKLYRQRRDLLRVHNAVAPLIEIGRRLSRVEMTAIDVNARPYFAEVADRVQRVDETFAALREALAFAFEASLMIGQSQQNDTTRRLASWAAILAVPTAVAGIYGMNFEHMPELKWQYGYPMVLGGIALACGLLYWRFRKAGWL